MLAYARLCGLRAFALSAREVRLLAGGFACDCDSWFKLLARCAWGK